MAASVGVVVLVGCGASADEARRGDPVDIDVSSSVSAPPASPNTPSITSVDPTVVSEPEGAAPVLRLGDPIATIPNAIDLRVRPGTSEIYIAERLGRIHRLGDGVVLDISRSVEAGVEEGLLGMTFSAEGDAIYLNIVSESMTRIVEFAVNESGAIDVATERLLLEFEQPYEAHNGGELIIDGSGMLLIFSGDGGFVADPQRVALDRSSPLGKILRIDPTPGPDSPYGVPADNPFVDEDGWERLIWAYGLRNPWRGHLDPVTADLWIGDVGDVDWEEINVGWGDEGSGRGLSFGWSAFEGPDRFNPDQPADGHTPPFLAYPNRDGRCSITAGEVYRGEMIDGLDGWFVFSDFCDGIIRAIEITEERTPGREVIAAGSVSIPVSIRSGPDGELLIVSIDGDIVPLLAGR